MTQKTTTYLATAVRYFANPSLRGNAQETPEMEQRTIGVLSGLQARLPLVVLRLDEQNHYDSQAVVVLEHGRQIAYLAADDAHQCVAEYGERLRVGIPVRVTEVNVEKHGVFWVEKLLFLFLLLLIGAGGWSLLLWPCLLLLGRG